MDAAVSPDNTQGESAGTIRWRLNRAGIVNVYQYANETLHFHGGRLLLRGVNGSGKSTAMNMLLPFLLTTRQARIDAAGEQRGILKSWMLSGRDDLQPVGYLWIEFQRGDEYLVCGCGIRANRQSDRVTTWWFVTSKRPGIDLDLVAGRVALSAEGLRAALDGDAVFNERQRRDYQQLLEQRLFAGASIEQHINLIHKVRSPRVGDRIDVELRDYLVDALPRLSEQALEEAAKPLEDLEEHRRSVSELDKTLRAVSGLLDVYGHYCVSDLHGRVDAARQILKERRDHDRRERRLRKDAQSAAVEVDRLESQISEASRGQRRAQRKIEALMRSPAYEQGRQLDGHRQHVNELARQCEAAEQRVEASRQRADQSENELRQAQRRGLDDHAALNAALTEAAELAQRCRLDRRPPGRLGPVTDSGDTLGEPAPLDAAPIDNRLAATLAAVTRRRSDTEQLREALDGEQAARALLGQAESEHDRAVIAAERAAQRMADALRAVTVARAEWASRTEAWAGDALLLFEQAGLDAEPTATLTAATRSDDEAVADPEAVLVELRAEIERLSGHWTQSAAGIRARLKTELETEQEACDLVDELALKTKLDTPTAPWQAAPDFCLADVVDFNPDVDATRRAGLEGALQASGLLAARPSNGEFKLRDGELVAIAERAVENPLSDFLVVSIPERLEGSVHHDDVARLLASVSYDPSASGSALATDDGEFRAGPMRGRHVKERAEHIGEESRRAAMAAARAEAQERLREASAAVARSRDRLARCEQSRNDAQRQRDSLPATDAIRQARAKAEAMTANHDEAVARHDEAHAGVQQAERDLAAVSDRLHSTATTLSLPHDADGLTAFVQHLGATHTTLENCRAALATLARSLEAWAGAWSRRAEAVAAHDDELAEHGRVAELHAAERDALATMEENLGAAYEKVVAACERLRREADRLAVEEPRLRGERDSAFARKVGAEASAKAAAGLRARSDESCDRARTSLAEVVATPGYLSAIKVVTDAAASASAGTQPVDSTAVVASNAAGAEGLKELLDALAVFLTLPRQDVPADRVRQSLMQRRAALGAGWDAEDRQAEGRPLEVEVNGPLGRATLPDAVQVVSRQHQNTAGLLDRQQDEALRQLLQGLIANEIAERIFDAERLVTHMNTRLGEVATAHKVGVELRWRRSRELDDTTQRMVELLSRKPELRTEDETSELRRVLSARLDTARADEPDLPYRQLIEDTLDYKQWHEMAVMVRRGAEDKKRLSRSTPLSEGEKKLVTYLPLFAAVSASCDALAERQRNPGAASPGIARFVLLDDAFAKVSEDNHAALFGLLVSLDLDFIATSERLWGTHDTVPELAITEVIRDASLGAILLEHYRWDGVTLSSEAA